MNSALTYIILILSIFTMISCSNNNINLKTKTAANILGDSNYQAIAYSGYRGLSREYQPTIGQIREDLLLLYAMDIKVIRTYNVYLDQTSNILKAIKEIKTKDPNFEMYVMLGAWISCKNAFTDNPQHNIESEKNAGEIERAIQLAKQYPEIVKMIAVGNEAMVRWAQSYYVQPSVILKWVKYLQDKKHSGKLDKGLWITSSDNYASWGGGDTSYHTKDLHELIKNVDFISMHTYAMHDTHYNPDFWGSLDSETNLPHIIKIEKAMHRAANYSISQYNNVVKYIRSIDADKPVHIGETGWATYSSGYYGNNGSFATDEFKSALYYNYIRQWSNENGITCFFFEGFDEPWKDAQNPNGSENHFGLFNIKAQAKYILWDLVDAGTFNGLTRDGMRITKTYDGNMDSLLKDVSLPPLKMSLEPKL